MKTIFFSLLLFFSFFGKTVAQQIAVNKDSLKIFGFNDTLFIYNTEPPMLTIDSLYSIHPYYGYGLSISTKDSSFFSYISSFARPNLNLKLAENDTVMFVFDYRVDLCTICKKSSINEYFKDTLKLISNSKLNDTLLLFVEGDGFTVGVENEEIVPARFILYQNYPNPFNPSTIISWQMATGGKVKLVIYDILGREIETLTDKYYSMGKYSVNFDANKLPGGIYFYSLTAGNFHQTKKMILLK